MPTGKPSKRRAYNGVVEMKDGTFYTVTYLAEKYDVTDFVIRERIKHYKLQPQRIGIMEVYPDDERLGTNFKFRTVRTHNPGDFRTGFDERRLYNRTQMELVKDITEMNRKVEALAVSFPHLDVLVHNLMSEVLFLQELVTIPYPDRKRKWAERFLQNNGIDPIEDKNGE